MLFFLVGQWILLITFLKLYPTEVAIYISCVVVEINVTTKFDIKECHSYNIVDICLLLAFFCDS